MIIRDYKKFPFDMVRNMKEAKSGRGHKKTIKTYRHGKKITYHISRINAISAFDIETSKIPHEEHSVMFIWQFHFMNLDTDENYTVLGRTWKEFLDFMNKLSYALEDKTLLVFVHNFNYEFSYLKSLIEFKNRFGDVEIFSKDPHHPVYAFSHFGAFEWRDSYALSNTKLEEFTKGLPHAKLDGDDFDYTKKRFSWTPLTEQEEQYCINDVWGLCEAVKRELDDHGDTVYSLVKTLTSYVRRDVSAIMYPLNRLNLYPADPYDTYCDLRSAYRGGDTHSNRWMTGYKLAAEKGLAVTSYDRSSSYPDCIVNDLFTLKPFEPDPNMTLEHLEELERDGYGYLMTIMLTDVKLKDETWPDPYLAVAKVEFPIGVKRKDNGRIIEACRVVIKCLWIDWALIREQYTWSNATISSLGVSKLGKLPQGLIDYVKELYIKKTELKGVKGEEGAYRISKSKINSVYGMMVQRVENTDVIFNEDTNELEYDPNNSKDPVDAYYAISQYRAMPYRWGCEVSAYARSHLARLIKLVGVDMVYVDTDSVKFIGDHTEEIKEFNKFFIERSKASGACAKDPKGKMHFMGEYECEGTYDEFKTMGAKKYADVKDGATEITISGVPKIAGAQQLVEFGGLDAFKPGTVFTAGKLRPKYNDGDDYGEREVYDCYGNKGKVKVTSNACLLDTSYKLSYGKDYQQTLNSLPELLEQHDEIMNAYQFFIDRGYTS